MSIKPNLDDLLIQIQALVNQLQAAVSAGKLLLPRFAYVVSQNGAPHQNIAAYTISLNPPPARGTLAFLGTAPADGMPTAVAADPSGQFIHVIYSDALGDGYIWSLGSTSLTNPSQPIATGPAPISVVVDPTGQFAYVVNSGDNSVSAYTIHIRTGVSPLGSSVSLTPNDPSTGRVPTGAAPRSIAVHPSGRFAYVVNTTNGTVSAYTITQTAPNAGQLQGNDPAGGAVRTGQGPYSIAVHPSGQFAYVVNNTDNTVWAYQIIQTGTNAGQLKPGGVTARTGQGPNSIAVHPSGRFAYVVNNTDGTVSAYTINQTGMDAGQQLQKNDPAGGAVRTGISPLSIAVDPFGQFACVANGGDNTVSAYTINQVGKTAGQLTFVGPAPAPENLTGSCSVVVAVVPSEFLLP